MGREERNALVPLRQPPPRAATRIGPFLVVDQHDGPHRFGEPAEEHALAAQQSYGAVVTGGRTSWNEKGGYSWTSDP